MLAFFFFFHQVVSLLTSAHPKSDSPQLCVDELTALPDSKKRGGKKKSLESHYNFTMTGASPPCQGNSSPLKRPARGFINQFLHEAPGMSPSIPLSLFFWPAETQCQDVIAWASVRDYWLFFIPCFLSVHFGRHGLTDKMCRSSVESYVTSIREWTLLQVTWTND